MLSWIHLELMSVISHLRKKRKREGGEFLSQYCFPGAEAQIKFHILKASRKSHTMLLSKSNCLVALNHVAPPRFKRGWEV